MQTLGKSPGEVVAWCCGKKVSQSDLVAALRACELPEKLARERLPRHAFARACHRMSEQRIIRPVSDADGFLEFQFTKEIECPPGGFVPRDTKEIQENSGDAKLRYDFEAILKLDKATGDITCREEPVLARIAKDELDRAMTERTAADITRVIQRLFQGQADLFPIRPQGGCYFVPARHAEFLDRISQFAGRLGVDFRRLAIAATADGRRTIRRAVADGIESLIDEHRQAIDGFDGDTRESTLNRAADRIEETKFKIESYAEYLDEERQRLLDLLEDQKKALAGKLDAAVEEALA